MVILLKKRVTPNDSNLDIFRSQLIEYIFRQSQRYENDLIELNNHTVYRTADPIDHLEMIMAQTRAGTADKIFADIFQIIRWSYNRDNYTK